MIRIGQSPVTQCGDQHKPAQTDPGQEATARIQFGIFGPSAFGLDPAEDSRLVRLCGVHDEGERTSLYLKILLGMMSMVVLMSLGIIALGALNTMAIVLVLVITLSLVLMA